MSEDQKRKETKRAVVIPKSLYEKYEQRAKDEDKFVTEVIRDALRENAPKKKEEKKEDEDW